VRPALGTAVAVALCAAAAAGCGVGSGDDAGEVDLIVSRDFGSEVLVDGEESISESDTVLRVLDRSAEVETRYGGGFVQSIDGLSGVREEGRASDWFFYVNGIESPIGSAEYELGDGDRVWWDHHDWTSAMRVPAVVGAWPEPFVHGFGGDSWKAAILCLAPSEACDLVADRAAAAGVKASINRIPPSRSGRPLREIAIAFHLEDAAVIVVGPWRRLKELPPADLLSGPPSGSGVFATFTGEQRALLTLLNERGEPAGSLGRGAGLVAGLRPDQGPPTWVVTGTDRAGVEAAAELLDDDLEDHFAVATDGAGEPIGVPVP
jgi:Domain of unknown function (DUF4430)